MAIHLHFPEEAIQKIRDRGQGGRGIEVAIVALADAKRNVNIEAGEFRVHGVT